MVGIANFKKKSIICIILHLIVKIKVYYFTNPIISNFDKIFSYNMITIKNNGYEFDDFYRLLKNENHQ